ncbi:nucleoside 2-deoxyribosyltransferase [Labilibaculum filiforme]|uniref:Putative 2'-deoxynucleoside 5'-phosphate N-hydrolase 1 n=1 Tax=Labilibaculum filiforme TaxID=1940526 RepID=A0A2N3I5R7_9BACT|nr:nucleoside 2-deoxyribosyltransferase [Labilibaculum filiforme]PKQ65664.1 nucleoside 2-deoxyribosyltransferase [Labilibaculum filiforme]
MKIYFSGSIRGGQQDTDLYADLIRELKQYGTVLTEHIGCKTIDHTLTDQEIHDRDIAWVKESDIVIAEVTVPSLGVGYEIGRAIDMKKRIICLYRSLNGKTSSAMILGCKDLQCFQYSNLKEAIAIFKTNLKAK